MDTSQPDALSSAVRLRPAEQADDAAIHAMIRKERLNPLAITWSHFVLAVTQNGEIIGCCQVKTHRDGSRELASLVVCPEWRGQGVARLLIEYLLERTPGMLYLTCMDRLEPLYQRFGFQTLHDPATLPLYFRRTLGFFRVFHRLGLAPGQLLVMRRQPPSNLASHAPGSWHTPPGQ